MELKITNKVRDQKNLFLTYPQCPITKENALDFFQSVFGDNLKSWVVSEEKHEDGNPHIHALLVLNRQEKRSNIRFLDIPHNYGQQENILAAASNLIQSYHPNIQEARNVRDVYKYCIKDGIYISNIDFVTFGIKKQELKQQFFLDIINQKRTVQEFIQENPLELPQYERIYKSFQLFSLHQKIAIETTGVRGIYIYGEPGSGKSHFVREFFRKRELDIYIKPQNKWFDGYTGQAIILLDDLDTPMLGHHLKIWADKYACSGEVKGSTVPLLHKYFIITSNYSIDHLWSDKEGQQGQIIIDNSTLREAIDRRFQVFRADKRSDFDEIAVNIDLANLN